MYPNKFFCNFAKETRTDKKTNPSPILTQK